MILNDIQIQDILNGTTTNLSGIPEAYRTGLVAGIEQGRIDAENNGPIQQLYLSTVSRIVNSSISLPEPRPDPSTPTTIPTGNSPTVGEVSVQIDSAISGAISGLRIPGIGGVALETSGFIMGFILSTIGALPGNGEVPDWGAVNGSNIGSLIGGLALPAIAGLMVGGLIPSHCANIRSTSQSPSCAASASDAPASRQLPHFHPTARNYNDNSFG